MSAQPARPPAVRARKRASSRPTKIDWNAAFKAFCADRTLGFGGVARKFNVSYQSVRKHAKAEDWLERAAEIRAKAEERSAVEHTVESFQREAKALVQEMLVKLRERLASGEEVPKSADLSGIVRSGSLLHGEATDRVSLVDVQALVAGLVRITAKHVPAEHRDAVLGEFEEVERTFGTLVAIEGGSQS